MLAIYNTHKCVWKMNVCLPSVSWNKLTSWSIYIRIDTIKSLPPIPWEVGANKCAMTEFEIRAIYITKYT